jgi:hypothetical protein
MGQGPAEVRGSVIREITPATLPFLAGYLAAAIDRRFNLANQWTMKVYMDMDRGKLDLAYLYRLEATIHLRWPKKERAPSINDLLLDCPGSDLWIARTGES